MLALPLSFLLMDPVKYTRGFQKCRIIGISRYKTLITMTIIIVTHVTQRIYHACITSSDLDVVCMGIDPIAIIGVSGIFKVICNKEIQFEQ